MEDHEAKFPADIAFQLKSAILHLPSQISEGYTMDKPKSRKVYLEKASISCTEILNIFTTKEQLGTIPAEKLLELTPLVEEIHGMVQVELDDLNAKLSSTKINTDFFCHKTAIVDEGAQVGKDTKIWHFSHIMPQAKIGEKCKLGQNVYIANNVILGNNVKVQNNVSIYEGVTCEDEVFLGPSMVFTNVINPRSSVNRQGEYLQTIVEKGATIGANATVICGNRIGRYAFVGAGAVITTDVPPYALMMGVPAKQKGWRSEFGEPLHFDTEGKATCAGSGEEYQLIDGKVEKL